MERIKKIFEYRQMIFSLVKRELRGRYKGSALGFLWTFLNPLLQLFVYTFVFSTIMRSGIENYYIHLFVALVPWLFFSSCLTAGSGCIMASQDMVKKIYFPREVLPISFVTTAFINMLLTFLVVFVVIIVSGFGLEIKVLWYLIPFSLVEYFLALGLTMLFSALTVFFRDLEYILGIIAMAWQFLTPVMFSQEQVVTVLENKPKLLFLWNLNPMTPVVNGFRQVLYFKQAPDIKTLGFSVGLGFICLVIGWLTFGCLQKKFAEVM